MEQEKNNIRFCNLDIRIIEKLPYHNVNNNQISIKVTKQEVKKIERFSATVSVEELKAKTKNIDSGYAFIFLGQNLETKCQKLKGYNFMKNSELRYQKCLKPEMIVV